MPRQLVRDFGASLKFNGVAQFSYRNAESVFNQAAYSVSFWVKGNPKADETIYCEGSSASATPCFIIGGGTTTPRAAKLCIFLRNDANETKIAFLDSTIVVFDGNWHHIVWTDSNGTCKLYIDGVADATNFNYTKSGVYTFNQTGWGARYRNTIGNYFQGYADNLKLFTTALTATQAQNLSLYGTNPTTPYLEWLCNEGSGTSLADSSGNSRTGTISGSAPFSSDVPMITRTAATRTAITGSRLDTNNLVRNDSSEFMDQWDCLRAYIR
jgi:hypothetical protein